jgi:hypothetical protein
MATDLERLEPGQRVVYHVGKLARARQAGAIAIADAAWELAQAGLLDLCQRRRPDGQIEYIAVKRRKVDPTPVRPLLVESKHRRKAA